MDGKLGSDETWHMVRLTFHGPSESRMQSRGTGALQASGWTGCCRGSGVSRGLAPGPLAPAGNGQRHRCCTDTSENPFPICSAADLRGCLLSAPLSQRARRIPQTQQKLPLHVRSRLPLSKRRLPHNPKRSQSSLIWKGHDGPRPLEHQTKRDERTETG